MVTGIRHPVLPASDACAAGHPDEASSVPRSPIFPAQSDEFNTTFNRSCELLSLKGMGVPEEKVHPVVLSPAPCPPGSGEGCRVSAAVESRAVAQRVEECATELEALWDDLEVPTADRGETMQALWQQVNAVFQEVVAAEQRKAVALRNELAGLLERTDRMERKLGWDDALTDKLPSCNSLASRVSTARRHLRFLEALHEDRMALFKLIQVVYEDLGGALETLPLPSDISLLVTVTEAELERCVCFLNTAGKSRESRLQNLLKEENADIEALCTKLKVPETEKEDFTRFQEEVLLHEPIGVREVTKDDLVALHHRLQADAQNDPPVTYADGEIATSLCGCGNLQEALDVTRQKKAKLLEEHRSRVGLQVSETKQLLADLWQQYHDLTQDPSFASPRVAQERKVPDTPTEANLTLVEGEVLQMEQKIESVKQVIASLRRRDEILKERQAMEAAQQDKDRLTDRSRNMAQILIKEEKIRNAVKKELPKIEKQLRQFCQSYRAANNGTAFWYNGVCLEKQLDSEDGNGGGSARRSKSPVSTLRRNTASSAAKPVSTPVGRASARGSVTGRPPMR